MVKLREGHEATVWSRYSLLSNPREGLILPILVQASLGKHSGQAPLGHFINHCVLGGLTLCSHILDDRKFQRVKSLCPLIPLGVLRVPTSIQNLVQVFPLFCGSHSVGHVHETSLVRQEWRQYHSLMGHRWKQAATPLDWPGMLLLPLFQEPAIFTLAMGSLLLTMLLLGVVENTARFLMPMNSWHGPLAWYCRGPSQEVYLLRGCNSAPVLVSVATLSPDRQGRLAPCVAGSLLLLMSAKLEWQCLYLNSERHVPCPFSRNEKWGDFDSVGQNAEGFASHTYKLLQSIQPNRVDGWGWGGFPNTFQVICKCMFLGVNSVLVSIRAISI